jgi:3',5'-cyclic AMP phosphodiesterase CpdA
VAFWILQISDMHCGPMSHWRQFPPSESAELSFNEIRDALRNGGIMPKLDVPKFDVLLLSGDFSWGPRFQNRTQYLEGFETAAALIKLFLQNGLCTRKGLMVLPGNHDVVWSPSASAPMHLQEAAESCYRDFLQEIFPGERERLRPDLGYYEVFQHPDREYLFLSLNSSRIEARERAGTGYVGYGQVFDLLKRAAEIRPRENKPYFGIAALHHHLLPIEAVRLRAMVGETSAHVSYVTDGIDVLEALLQSGFSLALHGHLHMPFHYMYTQAIQGTRHPVSLAVSCAGSFSLGIHSQNISQSHQFQAIQITDHFIRFHSFEAPLRDPGRPREWKKTRVIEFQLPETINGTSARPTVYRWQLPEKRLSEARARRSLNDFKLFEGCLLLKGLSKGDGTALAKVREGIEGRRNELKSLSDKNFDEAFKYAIRRITEPGIMQEFYASFGKDDPWYLEELLISFMNDWQAGLSASG